MLPTLNNLLENREVQLEDGSFLLNPSKYDQMLEEGATHEDLNQRNLYRAHDDFR